MDSLTPFTKITKNYVNVNFNHPSLENCGLTYALIVYLQNKGIKCYESTSPIFVYNYKTYEAKSKKTYTWDFSIDCLFENVYNYLLEQQANITIVNNVFFGVHVSGTYYLIVRIATIE